MIKLRKRLIALVSLVMLTGCSQISYVQARDDFEILKDYYATYRDKGGSLNYEDWENFILGKTTSSVAPLDEQSNEPDESEKYQETRNAMKQFVLDATVIDEYDNNYSKSFYLYMNSFQTHVMSVDYVQS